jgi:hypothetical protein
MTREEDLVRSTTTAIAAAVRDVPPLRLGPAADDSLTVAPFTRGAHRPHRARRLRGWLAPLAAAAVVLALAISLVIVKHVDNGPVVPPASPASSATGSVPEYYVALYPIGPNGSVGREGSPEGLVVGNARTGKRLTFIAPRKGTSYMVVSAAADDGTFIVDSVPYGPQGYVNTPVDPPATWYLLRLSPGSTRVAVLTRLSIPALPSGTIGSAELSASGSELAMTLQTGLGGGMRTGGFRSPSRTELRIYSVATGRLLHSWSTTKPDVDGGDAGNALFGTVSNALSWVDEDRAIAFFTVDPDATRVLDVTGSGDDLMADSRTVWSMRLGTWNVNDYVPPCAGHPLPPLAAGGTTVECAGNTRFTRTGKDLRWTMTVATYSTAAPSVASSSYSFTADTGIASTGNDMSAITVGWSNPSGSVMIIIWGAGDLTNPRVHLHFDVLSDGTLTPLPIPPVIDHATLSNIAW